MNNQIFGERRTKTKVFVFKNKKWKVTLELESQQIDEFNRTGEGYLPDIIEKEIREAFSYLENVTVFVIDAGERSWPITFDI